MKIPDKCKLQQIAFIHSPDTAFNEFLKMYKK